MPIQIVCDKCDQPFEVDAGTGALRAECPYCGDVNRIPSSTEASPRPVGRPVRAVGDGGRAAPGLVNADEERICIVRAAMFRAHPFWYTLMVLLFLGGLFAAAAGVPWAPLGGPLPGLVLAALAALWWLIWWAAPHRWVKLIITSRRTIRQEGIIVRRTSEVLHNHIRNVKIEQSVLQRLFGVGRLSIDSAGGSDEQPIEIEMNHVPGPYRIKAVIDRYRQM
jgi:membrane protein YdbS with pleckstrin-like domain/phage FluMu protein Com